MKKNKKMTYVLLFVVISLWVVVFYRLYQSFFSEEKLAAVPNKIPSAKIKTEVNGKFILQANYRDPFFGKYISDKVSEKATVVQKKIEKPKVEKEQEVVIDWSFINYIGLIKNQKNQKRVALVSIHGREYMISEGDTVQNVSFLKYYKDSVQVSYERKTTHLRKK